MIFPRSLGLNGIYNLIILLCFLCFGDSQADLLIVSLLVVSVAHEKHWPLSSSASERLARIRSPGRPSWNDLSVERVCRSISRINAGELCLFSLYF